MNRGSWRAGISAAVLSIGLLASATAGGESGTPAPPEAIVLVPVDADADLDALLASLDAGDLVDDLEGLGLDVTERSLGDLASGPAWDEPRTQVWFLVAPTSPGPGTDEATPTTTSSTSTTSTTTSTSLPEQVDGDDASGAAAPTAEGEVGSSTTSTATSTSTSTSTSTTSTSTSTTSTSTTTTVPTVQDVSLGSASDPVCAPDGRGNDGRDQPIAAGTLVNVWNDLQQQPDRAAPRLICSPEAFRSVVLDAAAAVGGTATTADGTVALDQAGAGQLELDLPEGTELASVAVTSPVALSATSDGEVVELQVVDEVPEGTRVELQPTLRLGGSDVTWAAAEPVTVVLDAWSPQVPPGVAEADEGLPLWLLVLGGLVSAAIGLGAGYLWGRRRSPEVLAGAGPPDSAASVAPGGLVEPAPPAHDPSVEPVPPAPTVLALDLLPAGPVPATSSSAWRAAWPSLHLGDGVAPATNLSYLPPVSGPVDASLVWASPDDEPPVLGIYTEKKVGKGEDAEPTVLRKLGRVRRGSVPPPAFVAVYDGLGGGGSSLVELRSGQSRTQAFLGSRLVRDLTEGFALDRIGSGSTWGDPTAFADDLADTIKRSLAEREARLPANPSKVRSRMQATFPTTFAGAMVDAIGKGRNAEHRVTAIWAGDSRVYLLTQAHGLQQLSADHTRDADVLGQLVDDGPMTQKVSAAKNWRFSTSTTTVSGAFAVLCASDGVHGYVQTPGGTEAAIIGALDRAGSTQEWATLLSVRIAGYTGDDATLALTSVGWDSFKDLRKALLHRLPLLRETQEQPFDTVDRSDPEALRACREATWAAYRDTYTARMPVQTPDDGPPT